jgi:hypothetical protein
MPKSQGRKRSPKLQTQKILQERATMPWSKTKKFVVGALTTMAMIIGIVSGLVALLPRVSVQASAPFDPSHPYPIPFTVTNNGSITLYNVRFFVGLCNLVWGPGYGEGVTLKSEKPCNGPSDMRITDPTWSRQKFEVDQQHVVRYDDIIPHPSTDNGMRVHSAEISIVVQFQPWIIPWPVREKEFRYKTRKDEDGKLSWIPEPLEK